MIASEVRNAVVITMTNTQTPGNQKNAEEIVTEICEKREISTIEDLTVITQIHIADNQREIREQKRVNQINL